MDIKELLQKELTKDTVFKNRNLLSPFYIPDLLPFREKQIEIAIRVLAPALKGNNTNNLFLYGKVGTGKTVTTKKVLKTMISYAEEQKSNVKGIYINCRITNRKYGVLVKIAQDIFPDDNLQGFSLTFLYDKVRNSINESGQQMIVILDEVDKVKDVDDLIYTLTRMNGEITQGGLTLIGISNLASFKDRLDARTRSTLCEEELVFPPYNAEELQKILTERVTDGFNEGVVTNSAISLAAALASQESGDARKALMLMLRAGDVADERGKKDVDESDVKKAREKVEEDIILNLISTLPQQHQLVLYTIANLTLNNKGARKLRGGLEVGLLYSGEVYDNYVRIVKTLGRNPTSDRWYRECIRELDTYGLIRTKDSGKGIRGHTRLIKMNHSARKVKDVLENELGLNAS